MKTATRKPLKKDPPLVRTCGAMQVHNRLLETNPSFRMRQASLEDATKRRLA